MSVGVEALFTSALGVQLPWVVEDVKLDTAKRRIDFEIGCQGAAQACPTCGAGVQPVHDRLRRSWRHLDFFQFEAWLHCDVPRIACTGCGKTTQMPVPWARPGSGFTAAFEALALALCRELPVRQAAGLLRCADKQLWRRIEFYVGQARALESFAGAQIVAIFETLSQQLQQHGLIPRGGQIVDASIVQAPITQANAKEREALNRGDAPEGWSAKRLAHTDRGARWTIKHGKAFYGYKLHGNVDARYRLIRALKITPANADDGQQLPDVQQAANTRDQLLADRGYDSQANRQALQARGLQDGIARRAKPGQTTKVRLNQRNRTINKTRARVEHVFASLAQQGGKCVRAMTLARNALAITL